LIILSFLNRPKINEKIQIEVLASHEIKELSYLISSRGKLCESKNVTFESAKTYILEIIPTFMMIPKATVVISYFTINGEIISDRIDVMFGNELINYVRKISFIFLNLKKNNYLN
jgi:hypothetical protein